MRVRDALVFAPRAADTDRDRCGRDVVSVARDGIGARDATSDTDERSCERLLERVGLTLALLFVEQYRVCDADSGLERRSDGVAARERLGFGLCARKFDAAREQQRESQR